MLKCSQALLVLNYLVRNGSERVVTSAREHIYDLRGLENYTYVDEFGKDQGINVRSVASLTIHLHYFYLISYPLKIYL